jgi:glycosyltransferase involved in cell wall biosynthesis
MKDRKKILLINPWAINNDSYYASGFISGANNYLKVDFATNYYYKGEKPNNNIYAIFFKRSELMGASKKRKFLRGIEYVLGWRKIIRLVKDNKYDIIHIHWLLMYKIDLFFIKQLRKYTKRAILTAHNVIPHVNGEKSIPILKKIYGQFDYILVHGESIKDEFISYFPEQKDHVKIQYHGEYYQQSISFEESNQEDFVELSKKINSYNKIFIMFGAHFYNKGTDRLIRIWNEEFKKSNTLLIILGKCNVDYPELEGLRDIIKNTHNLIFIEHFVDDNTLNYAITNSDCIIIPYRHASMSGVVYTAAAFSKPILCTKSGAIAEYLENGKDSILCENDDDSLRAALIEIENMRKDVLAEKGMTLSKNIHEKYSWNNIIKCLNETVYR